jgi:hypothetical protein
MKGILSVIKKTVPISKENALDSAVKAYLSVRSSDSGAWIMSSHFAAKLFSETNRSCLTQTVINGQTVNLFMGKEVQVVEKIAEKVHAFYANMRESYCLVEGDMSVVRDKVTDVPNVIITICYGIGGCPLPLASENAVIITD